MDIPKEASEAVAKAIAQEFNLNALYGNSTDNEIADIAISAYEDWQRENQVIPSHMQPVQTQTSDWDDGSLVVTVLDPLYRLAPTEQELTKDG